VVSDAVGSPDRINTTLRRILLILAAGRPHDVSEQRIGGIAAPLVLR
jgi:hypothetical protein